MVRQLNYVVVYLNTLTPYCGSSLLIKELYGCNYGAGRPLKASWGNAECSIEIDLRSTCQSLVVVLLPVAGLTINYYSVQTDMMTLGWD